MDTDSQPLSRQQLLETLTDLDIVHTTHDHPPIFTVQEGAAIKAALPGGHTKNLFLKDKTGALFLICALGDTIVPINKLHKRLGCKRLSFGKAELLYTQLGVRPGSVTFFSIINDHNNKVTLILDEALFSHALVNFHPMENTATTAIASKDLLTFAQHTHHTAVKVDFKALQDATNSPS